MWLCLNDAFLSIVRKDCGPDELLVRARRAGDIRKLFPGARVRKDEQADYRFRAVVKKQEIALRIIDEVMAIDYDNFKDSVRDRKLHDAYLRVWQNMAALQPNKMGGFPL